MEAEEEQTEFSERQKPDQKVSHLRRAARLLFLCGACTFLVTGILMEVGVRNRYVNGLWLLSLVASLVAAGPLVIGQLLTDIPTVLATCLVCQAIIIFFFFRELSALTVFSTLVGLAGVAWMLKTCGKRAEAPLDGGCSRADEQATGDDS